jgi:thymidylate synthase
MRYSLTNNKIPIITTKKMAWRVCLKELLWFINGSTNNEILQKQNVNIWNANASRKFLDSRGLYNLKENDLGPIYGHQWRHWNAKYSDFNENYKNKGIDQLNNVINDLKNKNFSRRMIMTAWNPEQINQMALPPCHVLVHFNVLQDKLLSCSVYQRSGDVGLGIPFNILSYSFLTHLIAHHCDLVPHEFIHHIGNAHIYENHIANLEYQSKLTPLIFPILNINNKYNSIDDYNIDDFDIYNYNHLGINNMSMVA